MANQSIYDAFSRFWCHVIARTGDMIATAKAYTDEKVAMSVMESIVTTSGTGEAYTATVDSITELTAGVSFVMIPNTVSTTTMPSLNVNNLGEKYIRRRLSNSTSTTVAGSSANWIGANKPVRVTYDGTYWVLDLIRPSATDIYGTVPIASGGTGASNGATALANLFGAGYTVLSSYQYGDTLPEPGTPGRIFFKKVNS